MAHINRDGDTVPGVDYTMICSRYDEVVTPWRTQQMDAGEGAVVRNILVQDEGNGRDFSEHLALLYSPRALDIALEALDHGPEGDYRRRRPTVRGAVVPLWGAVGKRRNVASSTVSATAPAGTEATAAGNSPRTRKAPPCVSERGRGLPEKQSGQTGARPEPGRPGRTTLRTP